jgi:hypothetical protein
MTDSSTCITDRHREMHEANGAHPESRTRSRVRREAGSRSRRTGDGGRVPSRELAQSSRRHSSGYCRCMLLHDQPLDLWDTYSWRHARRSTGGSPRLFGSAVERAVRAVRVLARLRLARHSGLDESEQHSQAATACPLGHRSSHQRGGQLTVALGVTGPDPWAIRRDRSSPEAGTDRAGGGRSGRRVGRARL